MAVESISACALHYVRFRMYLAILCIDALWIDQQDDWEEPSAAQMLAENLEILASGLDFHGIWTCIDSRPLKRRCLLTVGSIEATNFTHSPGLILAEACLPTKPCKSPTDNRDSNVLGSVERLS